LQTLERAWPAVLERARRRVETGMRPTLAARCWQVLDSTCGHDPGLLTDLEAAAATQPQLPSLRTTLGIALARGTARPDRAALVRACDQFRQALAQDPGNVLAGLNLAEALAAARHAAPAVEQARATLTALARCDAPDPAPLDAGHLAPGFDDFRVAWERAAWANAGDPAAEARAKRDLLRWQLHLLRGSWTDDLVHFAQA